MITRCAGRDRGQASGARLTTADVCRPSWANGAYTSHHANGEDSDATAIPKLLEMLDIRRATITIDAIGCEKKIVEKIIDAGADYVIAVKDSQPTLHQEIQDAFSALQSAEEEIPTEARFEIADQAHGRTEVRRAPQL